MGGSPKRGKVAAGCMSRGRVILLAVLAIQLLLVVCVMKMPRLIFSGTSSHANSDLDAEEAAASGSTWLWRRFVAENAQTDGVVINTNPSPVSLLECKDRQGRSVECEEDIRTHPRRRVDSESVSAHGRLEFIRSLPQESRLRRRGGSTTSSRIYGDESAVDHHELDHLELGERRARAVPARSGRVGEESGVLRQRRGRSEESRFPARRRSDVVEDRRVAGARRGRVGDRLVSDPVDTTKSGSVSSRLRGSITDSLERDSFRFRGAGEGYGDRRRVEVAPAVRRIRRSARAPPVDDASEDNNLSEDMNISEDSASEDDLSQDGFSQDDLAENERSEDPDIAMARSEVSYADRRRAGSQRLRRAALNATRWSNPTSLETSEAEILVDDSDTELEKLEEQTNATGALLDARNGTLRDDALLTANATLSAQIGARNGTLEDIALSANVSSINAALIELFGADNASVELIDALTANTTLGAWFGAHNASLELVDALTANTTLGARLGAHNASLELIDAVTANKTLGAVFGAQNASLELVDALAANTTLGAWFRAHNVSLELVDALAANGTGINMTTLGARLQAQNASLELIDALAGNVSGINATSLGVRIGAHNAGLELLDELAANVSSTNATSLGARFGSHNASLQVDGLEVTVGSINATRGTRLGAPNASVELEALSGNVSSINATSLGARFGSQNVSPEVGALTANVGGANATRVARFGAQVGVNDTQNATCSRGLIYVYTLPKRFNAELVENCSSLLRWGDRCRELSNSGLGPSLDESPLGQKQGANNNDSGSGPWYGTDQFNGEVIFHQRMLTHPCRTRDSALAQAFYIPYYGGLDVARFLFNATDSNSTSDDRDKLAGELVDWLTRSPHWKRRHGVDHFLMLGRITWDFRRKGNHSHGWGSSLINMPAMANVTKIALERSPWDTTEMAIPYPTGFHPKNDEEIIDWQTSLRKSKRDLLFSFAGAPRKDFPNDFRTNLFNQCKQAERCEALNCSARKCEDDPLAATKLFTRSTFCLQPRGDSFTRRSVFDSLVAGCIPVFFWTKSAYLQYYWHLPTDYTSYSVFIPKDDILRGAKVEEILLAIEPGKVHQMQETILAMIPRLEYARPEHELVKFKDAFDTTIDKVMGTVGDDQLRLGIRNHTVSNSTVEHTIKQADDDLARPIEENPKNPK